MGLGGRHEEGDLWILSVPKGVLRSVGICLSREREQVWHDSWFVFLTHGLQYLAQYHNR